MPLSPRPTAFVPRPVHVPVHSIPVFFAQLVAALVHTARAPGVLALAVVLAVAEISLVGVGVGLEDAVTLEFSVEELALELITILEADLAMAVLEVVVELPLVNVLPNLLQPALPLEAVVSKLSFVDLLAVGRDKLAFLKLVVPENTRVSGLVLLEHPQSAGLVILPGALVESALWPLHAPLPVLGRPRHLPDVHLSSLVPDPELVIGEWLDVGIDGRHVGGLGNVDGEGSAGRCGERVIIGLLGEGLAFFAELGVAHRSKIILIC